MPRGLTDEQQKYVQSVLADLTLRFPNQKELGNRVGLDQSRISAARSTGKTSLQVLVDAALLAGRPADEIARMVGIKSTISDEPPIGQVIMGIDRLPGLRRWIEKHGEIRASELAKAIEIYDENPPKAREDGQPFNGWSAFFDDVRAGRIAGPKKLGDQSRAEAAEEAQLPAGTRKRLKS